MALLGIDVGGTFTGAVLVEDGRVTTAKAMLRLSAGDVITVETRGGFGSPAAEESG